MTSTNPLNLSETRAGVEGLKIDESLGSLSLGVLGGAFSESSTDYDSLSHNIKYVRRFSNV